MFGLLTAALSMTGAVAAPAGPVPVPPVAEIRRSLAGEWRGALGYRDYQTNQLTELPVSTTIETVPDGVTQVRRSVFDEGPRRAPVWITSVTQTQGETLVTATLRAGRPAELQQEQANVVRYASPTDWRIVYRQSGTDDDKPAEIRVTETLAGDNLISIKEVRPAGDGGAAWAFRNQTRLTRVPR